MPGTVSCSISIRSLTQFDSENDLKAFISGPLSDVIYSDWENLRKIELEGSNGITARGFLPSVEEVETRGGSVSCSIGFDF